MTLCSSVRSTSHSPAPRSDCRRLRAANGWSPVIVAFASLLLLGGCVIPVEGDLSAARAVEPVETPLAPGERIVIAAHNIDADNDDAVECVRADAEDMLPEGTLVDARTFRAIPGVSEAAASGSIEEHLTSLAQNDEARTNIHSEGIRFVVEVASFKDVQETGRSVYGSESTSFVAWFLDTLDGSVLGPARVTVDGETVYVYAPLPPFLFFAREPVTEGPACRSMAAIVVSAITGKPLAEMSPELAAAAERGAEEARIQEAKLLEAEAKRLEALAAQQQGYFELWSLTCRAVMSNKPQAVAGLNALWLGGSYRIGNAPGGVDPVHALAWITFASEGLRREGEPPDRFAALAAEELQQLQAELSVDDRSTAQALVDSWQSNSVVCDVDQTQATLESLEEWGDAIGKFDVWWRNNTIGDVGGGALAFLRYCRLAMQRDSGGLHNFGYRYQSGHSPFQLDRVEAYKWFVLARDAGHAKGEERLANLRTQMTAAEIAEAERRAAEWSPDPSFCVRAIEPAATS